MVQRIAVFTLLACLSAIRPGYGDEGPRKIVVCSTTQVADFARRVVGDRWEVRCVLAPGQDPHLYRVLPSDVRLVKGASLCLENGWHLEGNDWMKTLAKDSGVPLITCVTGVPPILLKDEDKELEVHDPHAWFTPSNAGIYVRNILKAVSELDPDHADEYKARTELYLTQLRALHNWILKQCNSIPRERRVLITSHDAFNYFCREYGFKSASPVGWSTGQEIGSDITFERRKKAVDSIKKFGVKAIFFETTVNKKVIRQIAVEANVKLGGELYSDSMGETDTAGETYIGMLTENVLRIVTALK